MAEFFFCVRLHHANTTLAANEFLYLPRTASFRHTQDGARRMQAQTNEKYTLARLFWAQTVKPNWNHCGAHPAPQKKSTKTLRYMMPLVNINIPHFHFYPTYAKRTLQIWKPKKKWLVPRCPSQTCINEDGTGVTSALASGSHLPPLHLPFFESFNIFQYDLGKKNCRGDWGAAVLAPDFGGSIPLGLFDIGRIFLFDLHFCV